MPAVMSERSQDNAHPPAGPPHPPPHPQVPGPAARRLHATLQRLIRAGGGRRIRAPRAGPAGRCRVATAGIATAAGSRVLASVGLPVADLRRNERERVGRSARRATFASATTLPTTPLLQLQPLHCSRVGFAQFCCVLRMETFYVASVCRLSRDSRSRRRRAAASTSSWSARNSCAYIRSVLVR